MSDSILLAFLRRALDCKHQLDLQRMTGEPIDVNDEMSYSSSMDFFLQMASTDCSICNKPLDMKAPWNLGGIECWTLGCQHVVHKNCWLQRVQNCKRDMTKYGSKQTSDDLHCPVCNTWVGPMGCIGVDDPSVTQMIVMNKDDRGHHEWKKPEVWWAQEFDELVNQVLGACYQSHCWETTRAEGTLVDEQVFIRKCRNRMQKARGGQQLMDAFEAELGRLAALYPDASKLIENDALFHVIDLLSDCFLLHIVETKKGKCVRPAEAHVWLPHLDSWLRSTGEVQEEIAGHRARLLRRHPELKPAKK